MRAVSLHRRFCSFAFNIFAVYDDQTISCGQKKIIFFIWQHCNESIFILSFSAKLAKHQWTHTLSCCLSFWRQEIWKLKTAKLLMCQASNLLSAANCYHSWMEENRHLHIWDLSISLCKTCICFLQGNCEWGLHTFLLGWTVLSRICFWLSRMI